MRRELTALLEGFEFLGISLNEYPREMVNRYSGKLIVVASGRCVWDDLEALGLKGGHYTGAYHVMCVNDVVMHYPGRVSHLYSNDRRRIPGWLQIRRDEIQREYGAVDHTHSCRDGAKHKWPWPGHGSSSLGAVYTGLAMGYEEIVLCGVPLDDSGHYFDPHWKKTNFTREVGQKASGEMMYWANAAKNCFKGRVKSMSGRTRELLG